MYMAYGWPQVIPVDRGLSPSSQKIIYFKIINRLLLVVSPTHLELWSSSQVTNKLALLLFSTSPWYSVFFRGGLLVLLATGLMLFCFCVISIR